MAMDLARYLAVNRIEPTPANAHRVGRVREAAVYLRARAYRRWHRGDRNAAADAAWLAASRASETFERRHLGALLRVEA